MSAPALHTYRQLLRSITLAFSNDSRVLLSAKHQARATFEQHASLDADSEEAQAQVAHAISVAEILKKNVVQAEKVEGEERYRLRLHEQIERGDNDSVKMPAASTPKPMKSTLAGCRRDLPGMEEKS